MPAADYTATVEAAALFDRPVAAVVAAGPDARQFLHNISTADVKALPVGGGCELYFCDARAKALFVAWVYHTSVDGTPAVWLDTTPGRAAALLQHLDRFLIAEAVELADVSSQYSQLHLTGPAANSVLDAVAGTGPDLAEFQQADRTLGGATCSVRRHDVLGLPGYDVVCRGEHHTEVRHALLAAGAVPGSPDTWEVLRVEAGSPVHGVDIDESRFVMEVGHAARAVSYTKGCFPGQEPIVMARDRAGRVNRQFLGLKVLAGGVLAGGTKLVRDGQEVGVVTSSVDSPRLGGPLALGYVHWKSADPGTRLVAEGVGGSRAVEVLGYPPLAPAVSPPGG